MKRKRLFVIICVGLLLLAALVIFLLLRPKNNPILLETPVIVLNDDTVKWEENLNAEKFEISINGQLAFIENTITEKKLSDGDTFKIRAIGDSVNTLTSEWSNVVTYSIPRYVITWKNGETTLEIDENVIKGAIPEYNGSIPEKEGTDRVSYIFVGWDSEIGPANSNKIYNAVFEEVENTFTVTWISEGTILEVDENVEYGQTPSYDGSTPFKNKDEMYTYIFTGWTPELEDVTGNITYTAVFSSQLNEFDVIFMSEDGTEILEQQKVSYGNSVEYSKGTPVKNPTNQYNYSFSKWVDSVGGNVEVDLERITEDTIVYASFSRILRKYSITIGVNNENYGEVSIEYIENVVYGTSIVIEGNKLIIGEYEVVALPYSNNAQYSYMFTNWSTTSSVVKDTTITANIERRTNVYTVTWKNENTILESTEVEYGIVPTYTGPVPTKPAQGSIIYLFTGWTPSVSAVTGNVVYNAVFENSENKFIVNYYNETGDILLGVDIVGYGEKSVYPNSLPTKETTEMYNYTFDKWVSSQGGSDATDLNYITGNKNVYASFKADLRTYKVTFCNYNGNVLKEETVQYGDSATAPDRVLRDGYRFTSWDVDYSYITGDLLVTAQFVQQFIVKFFDYDNSIIDIQYIDYGLSATSPISPTRENYTFIGWNSSYENVYSNLSIYAQYEKQIKVTFLDNKGNIIKEEMVDKGSSATAPELEEVVGYDFVGWDQLIINVQSDIIVNPIYEIKKYTVTFIDNLGNTIEVLNNINHGSNVNAPSVDEYYIDWRSYKVYGYTGWDTALENITADKVITAIYDVEITTPVIVVDGITIAQGETTAEVEIYIIGSFDIYGIDIELSYADELSVSSSGILIDTKLNETNSQNSGCNWKNDIKNNKFSITWSKGTGLSISKYLRVLKFTFEVESRIAVGDYLIDVLSDSYIINDQLEKVTPVIISGNVKITA